MNRNRYGMTAILKLREDNLDEVAIYSADVIKKGGLVVFPTETVYGLGADAYNSNAVGKIFKVKGRPQDNPLIVHISSYESFWRIFDNPPKRLYSYAQRLWPGPFTIVYYKGDIPDSVTAGLNTVAVRMPAHPLALKMIEHSGTSVAAPSANKSGRPSPTHPKHVIEDLYGEVDIIIDAGETLYGVESTVIDFTSEPPKLLRPGPITPEDLSKSLGIEIDVPEYVRKLGRVGEARSPGMKYRHYAPETPLILVEYHGEPLKNYIDRVIEISTDLMGRGRIGIIGTDETIGEYSSLDAKVDSFGSRSDLYGIAKNLFKKLREMDKEGLDYMIAEGFEDRGIGLTIMNRLRKAASKIIDRV